MLVSLAKRRIVTTALCRCCCFVTMAQHRLQGAFILSKKLKKTNIINLDSWTIPDVVDKNASPDPVIKVTKITLKNGTIIYV